MKQNKIKQQNSISVFGMGYIGVVTAIGLAKEGNKVIGLDINENIINGLKDLKLSFSEPGLDELLQNNEINKLLEFTTDPKYAFENSNISFICVGTPPLPDRTINLEFIKEVFKTFSLFLERKDTPHIFVNRSNHK